MSYNEKLMKARVWVYGIGLIIMMIGAACVFLASQGIDIHIK